jgi:hypothetical protein
MKDESQIAYILGGILAIIVFIVALIYLQGVVIQDLWNWFLTLEPVSLGPLTSRWHALGIALIFGMLTKETSYVTNKDDDRDPIVKITTPFATLLLTWVIGNIIHGLI